MASDLAFPRDSMISTDERSLRREFGWFMLFALVVLANFVADFLIRIIGKNLV